MARLNNIPPGEVLNEEFLLPLGITPYRLAKAIDVQQSRIGQIIKGERSITPDTAIRLGRFLHTTPQFWLNLRSLYDMEEAEQQGNSRAEYAAIHAYDEACTVA
jgi:addiction module HigA family antidote